MQDRLPLARLFDDYLARNPAEAGVVALFRELLAEDPDLSCHPGLLQALAEQRRRQVDAARLN